MESIKYGLGVLTHHWGQCVTRPGKSVYSLLLAIIANSGSMAHTDPDILDLLCERRNQGSLFSWDHEQCGHCELEQLLAIFPGRGEEEMRTEENEASPTEKQRLEPEKSSEIT